MIYLLDVCVLLAMGYDKHIHHARTEWWLREVFDRGTPFSFATCSMTECGFVRIAGDERSQASLGMWKVPAAIYVILKSKAQSFIFLRR